MSDGLEVFLTALGLFALSFFIYLGGLIGYKNGHADAVDQAKKEVVQMKLAKWVARDDGSTSFEWIAQPVQEGK